ncbi:galactokinase [Lederbergia wuyishanensis]|uniref:Galactokinase n=1 Tax=Lederbergia wuyishanensis TaxID=1347903 RepID=A0ABU0D8Z5_9BACI|nr:galactokinase [Lederbergia wuyishanensis]MCJ8007570.1 galactokinase [Lederbergia wuyishanensis]MDQ0344847.1 galactokinase [Lederbergia wuyishanensis]
MEKKKELREKFTEIFGDNGEIRTFFAPGRVNLIGEHTDYNGGHVFPCALDVGTTVLARKREDKVLRFYSMNFPDAGVIEAQLDSLLYKKEDDWANYPKGVVDVFQKEGKSIPTGLDLLFYGNIPNGAGLSSSASIELATGVMLNEVFNLNIDRVQIVKYAQKAENEFVGVNCGIMDQFACGMGKEGHAILLDCQTLEYTYSPLQLSDHVLVIANTNKRRGLADSKYNERRSECERALEQLQKELDIQSLGDLTVDEFEAHKYLIENETDRKRAKHAVSENARTLVAVEKLNEGDLEAFGKLMNASHLSLMKDYEVTGKELDALVEAAWNEDVLGARMTGAGFGGCTINLVNKEKLDDFIKNVGEVYEEATGLKADFYVVGIGDGAKEIVE